VKPVEESPKPRYGIVNFEKRKHPRFNIDLPIEYYQVDSTAHHNGRAINASEGGVLIYLSEPINLGQHLKMQLFFASGSSMNAIEMVVEVVWKDIHLDTGWGDYRCGVKFVDISPDDMTKLKNLLRSLLG